MNTLQFAPHTQPLAARLRPRGFDTFVGQSQLFGEDGAIRHLMQTGRDFPSVIFWGPPGTGKTTAAEIICRSLFGEFERMSGVMSAVKDIREAALRAEKRLALSDKKTFLFVDEIHRFNRAQQDALLPYVESGLLTLLAATTENPSYYVNHALLSRCRVFAFDALTETDLDQLIERALSDKEDGLGARGLLLSPEAKARLIEAAAGDARQVLVSLQIAADMLPSSQSEISLKLLEKALGRRVLGYDKQSEAHYGFISAFIKSMRGSDPHAAMHYLVRMLESGEDARFIARRMVIFASEDIGNADPQAIQVAVACMQSLEFSGMPEGYLPLSQAATYLASAPKSNAAYKAYLKAKGDLGQAASATVPQHLRNGSPDYTYPHDFEGNFVEQRYLPESLKDKTYYNPTQNGYERFIRERLHKLGKLEE